MPSKKLVAFNLAVLSKLREIDPDAADRLNAHGSQLGWWNNIHYWFTKGIAAEKAAEHVSNHNHHVNN